MTSADNIIRTQNGAATRRPAGPQRGAPAKVRPGKAHSGPPGKVHPGPPGKVHPGPPAGPAGDLADGAAHLAG
jgi:hypothetical protein